MGGHAAILGREQNLQVKLIYYILLNYFALTSLISLRIPSVQYDQLYKFRRSDADNANFPDDQQNGSETHHHPVKVTYAMDDKKTEIKKINSISPTTPAADLFRDQITDDSFTEFDKSHTATSIGAMTEVIEEYSYVTITIEYNKRTRNVYKIIYIYFKQTL